MSWDNYCASDDQDAAGLCCSVWDGRECIEIPLIILSLFGAEIRGDGNNARWLFFGVNTGIAGRSSGKAKQRNQNPLHEPQAEWAEVCVVCSISHRKLLGIPVEAVPVSSLS